MSGNIRVDQNAGIQNLPPSSGAEQAKQARATDHVWRGFSNKNFVSHQKNGSTEEGRVGKEGASMGR